MNEKNDTRIYRIDKFVVPAVAEKEFLAAVAETNMAFDNLAGCLQRHVLLGRKSEDESVYLTFVEWESMSAYEQALVAAQTKHKEMKMTPQLLFRRLGIDAELGVFAPAAGFNN